MDLILDHTDTPESDLERHAALPTQPLWHGNRHKFGRGSAGPVNAGRRSRHGASGRAVRRALVVAGPCRPVPRRRNAGRCGRSCCTNDDCQRPNGVRRPKRVKLHGCLHCTRCDPPPWTPVCCVQYARRENFVIIPRYRHVLYQSALTLTLRGVPNPSALRFR